VVQIHSQSVYSRIIDKYLVVFDMKTGSRVFKQPEGKSWNNKSLSENDKSLTFENWSKKSSHFSEGEEEEIQHSFKDTIMLLYDEYYHSTFD
jgi:hypothetical protein